MAIRVRPVLAGARGFDCNTPITPELARIFKQGGYAFAVRYVRRAAIAPHDLSAKEAYGLLYAGLGLMVVQHVALPGWLPSSGLGSHYGQIAASAARTAGIPAGVTVWCDLEGVSDESNSREVIEYCNSWFDMVKLAGFVPGLYVGYGCGLNATQLYKNLRFQHYWSAYNLNHDQIPVVRGVQMRQYASVSHDIPAGVDFPIDVNVVSPDLLGGLPTMVVSAEL